MGRLVGAIMALLMLAGVARADGFTAEQLMLMRLFGNDPITEQMFAPGFLAQVSMAQVESVILRTRSTIGPPVAIEPSGSGYIVKTRTYQLPVDIGLDTSGRIAALLLHPAAQNFSTTSEVLDAIAALPGTTSYLVTRNHQTLFARGQAAPVAVGSAFKLGVLAAVADSIGAGTLGWDTVVRLRRGEISLPTGQVQALPVGSPLTVHTLAALMVSQSDNTATDMLMDLVGRDKVAAQLGVDFVLKTTEFFKLKADPALRLRFVGATAAQKQALAAEMAKMPLPAAADVVTPLDQGVEWYLPSRTICRLLDAVAPLDVFTINPGVASSADWDHIAFKGGSEVGVASLNTALIDKAGNHYCVSVTWNDHQPLDETRFTSLYGSLLAKLAGR